MIVETILMIVIKIGIVRAAIVVGTIVNDRNSSRRNNSDRIAASAMMYAFAHSGPSLRARPVLRAVPTPT